MWSVRGLCRKAGDGRDVGLIHIGRKFNISVWVPSSLQYSEFSHSKPRRQHRTWWNADLACKRENNYWDLLQTQSFCLRMIKADNVNLNDSTKNFVARKIDWKVKNSAFKRKRMTQGKERSFPCSKIQNILQTMWEREQWAVNITAVPKRISF